MNWSHVEKCFYEQRGMVAGRQAETASQARQLRRVASRRNWYRPYRGVCGPRMPFDLRREQQAGLLWVSGTVAVTGWAALWLHGAVDRVPPKTHLLVAHSRRNRYRRRLHVIRTRHIEAAGISKVSGMDVVSAAWAVTDLAARATTQVLRAALIDGRQRGCYTFDQIHELLDERGPIPGRRRLRRLLTQLAEDGGDSSLEHLVRRRIRADSRLPEPAPGPVLVTASDGVRNEIDIGWPWRRVGLECLGFAAHSSRRQLHTDAVRSNALAPLGWTILHVTWSHLEDDRAWEVLVTQLRQHLARQAGSRDRLV